MKKLNIISSILSVITIITLLFSDIISINSDNVIFLPILYASLHVGYWFFGGIILITFFNFSPHEDIKPTENNNSISYYRTHKVQENNDDITKSIAIGYLTDNALVGGIIGGSYVGGIIGDSMDGDLFD